MCISPLKLTNFEIVGAKIFYLVDWGEEPIGKNAEATLKVIVKGKQYHVVAEGYHPLTAFFNALRNALMIDFSLVISPNMTICPESSLSTELEIAQCLDDLISGEPPHANGAD